MDRIARQSTAITVAVGPVLDAAGVLEAGLAIDDFDIIKNGGAAAALNGSASEVYSGAGIYLITLTTSDVDTVGSASIVVNDGGETSMKPYTMQVVEEAVYDAMFAASAAGYQVPIWSGPTATVSLTNTTVATVTTTTTATNLTNAPTNGDLTATMKTSVTTAATAATPTAAAVTGAVGSVTGNVGGNVTGSVGSVVGAVGSVTGAVGSVTGNVGGNVVGSVASVTGAVGSVTGNVGGNVTGSVGSVVGAVGSISGVTFPTNFSTILITSDGYISRVVLNDTTTTNTDMRGTDSAATAAALASLVTTVGAAGAGLTEAGGTGDQLTALATQLSVNDLPTNAELATAIIAGLTTALTEGYRGTGATGSVRDMLYEVLAHLGEFAISGTTKTTKKLDGSTTAKTYTLDDDTAPTSITEAT